MWNGYGTNYFAEGHKYTGEYKDYKLHGKGTFYFADGKKLALECKDGELIK